MRAPVDGRAVGYLRAGRGAGPTLVFLHFFGGSSRSWAGVMEEMGAERTCLAVDVPGFGVSDPLGPDCTVEAQAAAIEALLDRLEVGPCVLVGHSMGGKIAVVMAARRPHQVEGLVLVAPSPPWPEPGDPDERARLLAQHGDQAAMEALVDRIARRPLSPGLREATVEDHLAVTLDAWRWWLTDGVHEDVSDHLDGCRAHSVVVAGADDPVLSLDLHQALADRLGSARLQIVPGAGHLVPLEAPEDVAALIRSAARP